MDKSRVELNGRVELDSLADVTTFLSAAEHLKALTIQLAELRNRRSRREHSLACQIECITALVGDKVAGNPRLADLWRLAQVELRALASEPPTCAHSPPLGPCKGGTTP